jgi:hypothetical protein
MTKTINDIANEKFNNIKNKSIWKVIAAKAVENKPIDRDKINAAFQDKTDDEVDEEINFGKESNLLEGKALLVLGFLDDIELDNDLKIAISYIVASNDKDKIANLNKAIMIIEEKINENR